MSNKAMAGTDSIDSSNNSVKSKPPLQSLACGPKVLSTAAHDDKAMAIFDSNYRNCLRIDEAG